MKLIAAALVATTPFFAQATKPLFEVASIKPNISGLDGGQAHPTANGFTATNLTLWGILNYAVRPQQGQFFSQQMVGGPDWMRTDHFDIQAKASGDASLSREQIQAMVLSLLEDRFQLKIHREVRDLPVYDLVTANGKPKMQRSADQTPSTTGGRISFHSGDDEDPAPLPRGDIRLSKGSTDTILSASAVPMSKIVNLFQSSSDRIIVDKTDLPGLFDIHIRFREASSGADSAAPSMFTALQDLGLKLQPSKAPFEVVVVDSVSHPSEN